MNFYVSSDCYNFLIVFGGGKFYLYFFVDGNLQLRIDWDEFK